MRDFYAILGVSQTASQAEIKSAFRKRVKAKHPDTGVKNEEPIRILLEAYRVLSDLDLRYKYDLGRLQINKGPVDFDYRTWLKERLDKPEYIAKLVFYDLLHNFEDEAIQLYDEIKSKEDCRLERFFERVEAMDAEFCIAEEYRARTRYEDAYHVFKKLIAMEQSKPGFGYFYQVVLSRFRHLVLDDLPKVLDGNAMLGLLTEAIELNSSSDNNAQFLRHKAEILYRMKKNDEAFQAVIVAKRLSPKLPGLNSLSLRISNAMAKLTS